MFLNFLQRYSLKLVFALSLLIGLQFPNFLQQYELRLDAHLIESEHQLQQYQKLADLFFDGSLELLIQKHKESEVPLFQAETALIEKTLVRFHYWQSQQNAMQGTLVSRLYFLATQFNTPLFIETEANYKAEILLNQDSISVGLVLALLNTLLMELFFLFLIYLTKVILRNKKRFSRNN